MKKIFTLICLVSLLGLSGCDGSVEKKIIGKWKYTLVMDEDNENYKFDCTENFYPNKSVNYDCDFIMSLLEKLPESDSYVKSEVHGTLSGTGECSVSGSDVYDKSVDAKFTVEKFLLNDAEFTDSEFLKEIQNDLQSILLKGETSVRKTLNIDKTKWVFEMDIDSEKFVVSANKN